MKAVIFGSNTLESQANTQVRESIAQGWRELLGENDVISSAMGAAPYLIRTFRPRLALCVGSYLPESTYFGDAKRAALEVGTTLVYWATEDPYEIDASYRVATYFDAVFTCDSSAVGYYRGVDVEHLPLACCRERHFRTFVAIAQRNIDILFCGVAFGNRKRIVDAAKDTLKRYAVRFIGPGWGGYGAGFSDDRIEKDDLITLYANAKLVLNLGRNLHFENKRSMLTPSTPGPRTFEAALAGAPQLFLEDTPEIFRYFSRAEIATFSSPISFQAEIKRLIVSPLEAEAMAKSAQERAANEHTYYHRAETIMRSLKERAFL